MQKLKVTEGFRFSGKYYPESKKQQELPDDAAKFAVKEGLAVDPAKEKSKQESEAKAEAEQKAAEAEANKSLGNAPQNK